VDTPGEIEVAAAPTGAQRCPLCGGLNPARAEWCGQCLARFGPPSAPPPSPRRRDPEGADPLGAFPEDFDPLTAPTLHPPLLPESTGPASNSSRNSPVRTGAFGVSGDGITWSCSVCGEDNSLNARRCEICGASFAIAVSGPEPVPKRRDPNTAALYSLLFPGAGHAYLGLPGQAVARGVTSVWVMGVTLISIFSGGGNVSLVLSLCYGAAALGLWLVAAHDAYREANHQSGLTLLSGRRHVYLTVALIGILFVVMTLGALGLRGPIGG
jgi:hypothetical protein